MPKIKVGFSMGLVGCKKEAVIEIDDEGWNEMNEEERNTRLDQEARSYMEERVECYARVLED